MKNSNESKQKDNFGNPVIVGGVISFIASILYMMTSINLYLFVACSITFVMMLVFLFASWFVGFRFGFDINIESDFHLPMAISICTSITLTIFLLLIHFLRTI